MRFMMVRKRTHDDELRGFRHLGDSVRLKPDTTYNNKIACRDVVPVVVPAVRDLRGHSISLTDPRLPVTGSCTARWPP